MRVLMTGGAGGLGINVCQLLMQSGNKVRILDLQTKRNLKSVENFKDSVEVYWGDITRAESIQRSEESESLLHFQRFTYKDYLNDFAKQLSQQYGKLFLPFMRRFVGLLFGKAISRLM